MKLRPLAPRSVVPIAPGKAELEALETRLNVCRAGTAAFSVSEIEMPLSWNVCWTRWTTAWSKLCCCWTVGAPPKSWATCGLSYQAWGLPLAMKPAPG